MIWRTILLILTLALSPTGPAQAQTEPPRILVMGDSLMAMNRILGGSVAQALGKALGVKVTDNSTLGARYFFQVPVLNAAGMKIKAQFTEGPWDYVVMNGGGNDLLFGCGCGSCRGRSPRPMSRRARAPSPGRSPDRASSPISSRAASPASRGTSASRMATPSPACRSSSTATPAASPSPRASMRRRR